MLLLRRLRKGLQMRNKCYKCQTADQSKTSYLSGNARTQKIAIVEVKGQTFLTAQMLRLTHRVS